jgi:histidinol dehydrogenase
MIRLDINQPGFAEAFRAQVDDRRESDSNVADAVTAIIADVRKRGDDALADLTGRFDRHPC